MSAAGQNLGFSPAQEDLLTRMYALRRDAILFSGDGNPRVVWYLGREEHFQLRTLPLGFSSELREEQFLNFPVLRVDAGSHLNLAQRPVA